MEQNKKEKLMSTHLNIHGRRRVQRDLDPEHPGQTVQSQKDECDINKIMSRFALGGEINHINKAQAHYGDFSNALSFSDAYTAVANAEQAFAELPAHIRDLFGNDAEAFLYKLEDPEFVKKLEDLNVYDEEVGPIANKLKSAPVLDTQPKTGDGDASGTAPDSEAESPQSPTGESPIQGGE